MTGTLGFRYNIKEVVLTNVFCYPMPGQLCIVLMKMHLLKFAAPGFDNALVHLHIKWFLELNSKAMTFFGTINDVRTCSGCFKSS